jgi:hypothetical protein
VLEHYDEEHYCTMSSFRVYGISEYEYLLEDRDQHRLDRDIQFSSSLETVDATAHIQGKLKEVALFEKKEKVMKVRC